jgi:hypothetical protein
MTTYDQDLKIRDTAEKAAQTAAPLFRMYGWTWRDSKLPPTINELTRCIEELIIDLDNDDEGAICMSTGRFTVYKDIDRTNKSRDYKVFLNLANLTLEN